MFFLKGKRPYKIKCLVHLNLDFFRNYTRPLQNLTTGQNALERAGQRRRRHKNI
jgi:hypothetical protein